MNTVAIHSIGALSKWPTEASEVEKPPVAIVVMAWATDSKLVMPASRYEAAQIAVSAI